MGYMAGLFTSATIWSLPKLTKNETSQHSPGPSSPGMNLAGKATPKDCAALTRSGRSKPGGSGGAGRPTVSCPVGRRTTNCEKCGLESPREQLALANDLLRHGVAKVQIELTALTSFRRDSTS